MSTNNKSQQPARPALSRKEIEEIAREAARVEFQEILEKIVCLPYMNGDMLAQHFYAYVHPDIREHPHSGDLPHLSTDLPAPPLIPELPPVATPVVARPAIGERRFTAHLPHVEGKDSQVTGTRHYATGHVVLDDAKGVYGSWEAFLKAYHEQGQTPTEIVMEASEG